MSLGGSLLPSNPPPRTEASLDTAIFSVEIKDIWLSIIGVCMCILKVLVAQSCPTLCNPMDCSLPGSSVHGIFQARILDWVAISYPGILYLIVFKIILRMHGPNSIQLLNFEYRNHSL